MKQSLQFITLGVKDLDRMKAWYQEVFGWTILKEVDDIVFFKLNGFILSIFPADELAKDIGITHNGTGFKQFTLAINFSSEKEVDEAFAEVTKKGAVVVKPAEKVFWGGYSGYISDPEENYWEFACNPFLEMDAAGNVTGHQ